MSFMPTQTRQRLVPGVGRETAKIVIVGDYTDVYDQRALKPFSGPGGSVLESCMHAAGIIRGEVYMTNLFKSYTENRGKMAGFDFMDEGKRKFTAKGLEHVAMLKQELSKLRPNIIVAAGLGPTLALTRYGSSAKFRGYVTEAEGLPYTCKVIPTFSPASTIRGTYANRHIIVCDLRKAKHESEFPELKRPDRVVISEYANIEECLQYLEYYKDKELIAYDIEVINYEVSCISLSDDPKLACVFSFGGTDQRPNGWSELEELALWRGMQEVLGNPKSRKINQNGSMFDSHFLYTKYGVEIRGVSEDTMIGHSVIYPEFPKGLGFLGSIYCGSQEYWKDMVNFDNIKEES